MQSGPPPVLRKSSGVLLLGITDSRLSLRYIESSAAVPMHPIRRYRGGVVRYPLAHAICRKILARG